MELPGAGNQAVSVRAAHGLRGTLEQGDGRLALSDVSAESVELEALRIMLGDLVLSSVAGAKLTGLGLALEQSNGQLMLAATTASIVAEDLHVAVDDILVRGRVRLAAPELVVRGGEGSVASKRVEIADLVLRIGELELAADSVVGLSVKIAWGAAGFRLAAASLAAPSLRLTTADVELAASAVAVDALSLDGGTLSMARVALESGLLGLSFRPSTGATAAVAGPAEPVVEWGALDTLSGQLDVDVAVDLAVPIIGRRRATHRFRIAIDSGALDYRALERNLATLEDALLDFSVRDGALVLERVNPLFPARGHGKPIVIWDVDAADLELATRNRVRLAVLPLARFVGDAGEKDDAPSQSSTAVRELDLLQIEARLSLAPVTSLLRGQLRPRHIGSFVCGGNVFHEPGGSRAGSVLGELQDLSATLQGLALGTSRLDAASLTAVALAPIEIAFTDVNPSRVQVGLAGVVLERIALAL